PDDAAPVHDRVPAQLLLHAFQNRPDSPLAAIGNGSMAVDIEGEFLVLRPDAPVLERLAARGEIRDEFVDTLDRLRIRRVTRHAFPLVPASWPPRLMAEMAGWDQANSA